MSDCAVRAEGLSKRYRISARESVTTLRDKLAYLLSAPVRTVLPARNGRNFREAGPESQACIWALREVSFEVKRGEVIGIIGRNGAGKSTLLKVLSRVTAPTEGHAQVYGRVGSLLEIGTGFHPELSGRENIYLNGAILGMKKREIERKFDDIVAFAELEKFIDTPVKHYSSGMYLRLAFSVAAHLETEILLIDELLAVGDLAFQKRCLGKMGDVANEGRTVLFVSHSMAAINRLSRRAIWLDEGKTRMIGEVESVVAAYLATDAAAGSERVWSRREEAPGNEKIRLRAVRICAEEGGPVSTVGTHSGFFVEIAYDVLAELPPMRIVVKVATADGTIVFLTRDNYRNAWETNFRRPGKYLSRCHVPKDLLNAGIYSLTVSAEVPFVTVLFREEEVLRVVIERTGGVGGQYAESWPGVICPPLEWDVQRIDPSPSAPEQICSQK